VTANDYSDDKAWLCRPGRKGDACDIDLTTTVVAADGTTTREAFAPDPKAPIDCFYVYPTISTDTTATHRAHRRTGRPSRTRSAGRRAVCAVRRA